MKNRAKCKLCASIIESYHDTDYVSCKCGHISVDGGTSMKCAAIDWSNFLRVDDEGNEILVTVKSDKQNVDEELIQEKPSKAKMLEILDEMIKSYESLPKYAMEGAVTNYDLLSALILLSSILKA